MLFVDPHTTSAAYTAKRNDIDIANTVLEDVAICDSERCKGEDVAIDGCRLVNCTDTNFQETCSLATITNAINVIYTGTFACVSSSMSNVKNVTCSDDAACTGALIETIPNGFVSCQAPAAGKESSCYGEGPYSMKVTAGCLTCGVKACGGDFTFIDAKTKKQEKLNSDLNDVAKKYSQMCNPKKKCKGFFSCLWKWFTGIF